MYFGSFTKVEVDLVKHLKWFDFIGRLKPDNPADKSIIVLPQRTTKCSLFPFSYFSFV